MKLYLHFIIALLYCANVFAADTTYKIATSEKSDGKLIERKFEISPPTKTVEYNYPLIKIGAHSVPFSQIREVTTVDGQVDYDTTYNIGELGFRELPPKMSSKKFKTHFIVAGDSNTFGEGLNEEDTLPIQLVKNNEFAHPYNFGVRGGAPNNTLALMEFFPWNKLIKEEKGIFIYNYYDFLQERVIGARNVNEWSKGIDPQYDLDTSGDLIYKGAFKDNFQGKFFKMVNDSSFLRTLLPVMPRPQDRHSVIVAKIFLKMYNEYKKNFPEGSFYVVLSNYGIADAARMDKVKKELEKNHIPFITLPADQPYTAEMLFKDGHINSVGQKFAADLILKGLPPMN